MNHNNFNKAPLNINEKFKELAKLLGDKQSIQGKYKNAEVFISKQSDNSVIVTIKDQGDRFTRFCISDKNLEVTAEEPKISRGPYNAPFPYKEEREVEFKPMKVEFSLDDVLSNWVNYNDVLG